jgi:hypothetical protein
LIAETIFGNIETPVPHPASMSAENDFEKAAAEQKDKGIVVELWEFLRDNKKWWLLPIIVVLLLFGLLIFLAGTGLAPLIYTVF